jgi:hypothetical protein
MGLMRNFLISLAGSLAVFSTAFFKEIIPCQISPNVPNPTFVWGLCTLSPNKIIGLKKLYFGTTENLFNVQIASLIVVFLIIFIILSKFTKHNHSYSKHKKEDERR